MVEYSQVALVGLLIYPLTAEVVFKMYNYASTRHSHIKNKCILLFFLILWYWYVGYPKRWIYPKPTVKEQSEKIRACFKRHDSCQV